MKRFLAASRFEARLWLQTTGFWLAVLAMHFYAFGWYHFKSLVTSRGLAEPILGLGLPFAALFMLFTSASVMLRDRSEGTEELLDSMPPKSAHLFFSRWLGGVFVWLLLGLEIFAVGGAIIVLQDGAILEIWPVVSLYLSHYVPAVLFIHTLGMAVGTFVRQPFVLYPILIGLWAGMTLGAMSASFDQRLQFMTLFHLTGIGGDSIQRVSTLVGIFPFEGYVFWQRVFFAGLTILLIAGAMLTFRAQREKGDAQRPLRFRRSIVTSLIAVLLIGLGSAGYVQRYTTTTAALGHEDGIELLTPNLIAHEYDLQIRFEEDGRYTVRSRVNVANQGDTPLHEVGFVLSSGCYLVSDAANRNAKHSGSAVVHTLDTPLFPGDRADVGLVYECLVHPMDHRLPTPIARETLVDEIPYPFPRDGLLNLKRFTVTLDAPTSFKLAANIPKIAVEALNTKREITYYEGESTRLEVFGGPLTYEIIAGIEAYYYPSHAAAARNLVSQLADRISYFETWLGQPQYIPGVTPLPVVVETLAISSPTQARETKLGFLSVLEWQVPFYYNGDAETDLVLRHEMNDLALSLWWGDDPLGVFISGSITYGGGLTAVEIAAINYLGALHISEHDGGALYERGIAALLAEQEAERSNTFVIPNLETMTTLAHLGMFTLQRNSTHTATFLILHDLRAALGDSALKTVLQALQQHHTERAKARLETPVTAPPAPETGSNGLDREPLSAAAMLRHSTDDSIRFLLNTIHALPGGAEVAERSLQHLSVRIANQLRQEWRRGE